MTEYSWSAPVPVPRGAQVVVSDAVLPMLLWPAVPVIRLVYEDLTVIDRFIVEAALQVAPIRAEDIEEVTGIPRDAITRIAGRLTGMGLLRTEGPDYHPVEASARPALERRAVPEHRQVSLTFLYLPYTDDLVAFVPGPRRPDPPHLHKAKKVDLAPLLPEIAGLSRTALLRDRIQAGRIAGLPADMDIVDVVGGATEDPLPDWCPAYRCRGHVRSRGDTPMLVLDVIDTDGKRALKCTVPAAGQAGAWMALAEQAGAVGEVWQAQGGQVVADQRGPMKWSYLLDGTAAEAATCDGIALSRPAALMIQDDTNEVVVDAHFAPADERATRVFALDHAVRAIIETDPAKLKPDAVSTAVAEAKSSHGVSDDALTVADLMQRLWADHHYRHIYAMRTARDFAYD
jgi:hypothetical protein